MHTASYFEDPPFHNDPVLGGLGSVLGLEGRYYMYLAVMAGNCGLDSWQCNSECWLAVAEEPQGPYKSSLVTSRYRHILPWFRQFFAVIYHKLSPLDYAFLGDRGNTYSMEENEVRGQRALLYT